MPRPKRTGEPDKILSIKVPPALVDTLDRIVEGLRMQTGEPWTVSRFAREAIQDAARVALAEMKSKKGAKR